MTIRYQPSRLGTHNGMAAQAIALGPAPVSCFPKTCSRLLFLK